MTFMYIEVGRRCRCGRRYRFINVLQKGVGESEEYKTASTDMGIL